MKRMLGIFAVTLALLTTLSACKNEELPPDASQSSSPTANDDSSSQVPEASNTDITAAPPVTQETTLPPDDLIDMENGIVQTAHELIGIPFAENGASPSAGFDNSGFIYYVLRENGFINCPRLTGDQAGMGTHIAYDELKSGDLAFFSTNDSGNADFGGIYIGEGQMIYCPMPGQTVKVADITTDYWKNAFAVGVSLS